MTPELRAYLAALLDVVEMLDERVGGDLRGSIHELQRVLNELPTQDLRNALEGGSP